MRSEGYGSWSVVGLCVCRRLFWLRGGQLAIPAAYELREPEYEKGVFPETIAFERYAVKTSQKANMHNRIGCIYCDLIRPLCVPWRLRKSQRKACITACYLLPQLARVRLSARY